MKHDWAALVLCDPLLKNTVIEAENVCDIQNLTSETGNLLNPDECDV